MLFDSFPLIATSPLLKDLNFQPSVADELKDGLMEEHVQLRGNINQTLTDEIRSMIIFLAQTLVDGCFRLAGPPNSGSSARAWAASLGRPAPQRVRTVHPSGVTHPGSMRPGASLWSSLGWHRPATKEG